MVKSDEKMKFEANEWKYAAMVFDRLCLIITILFILISFTYFVASAPYLFA